MKTRVCTKCTKSFPETQRYFTPHKESKNGLERRCRECSRKSSREWYRKNGEQGRIYQREWQRKNFEKSRKKTREWARKARTDVLKVYGGNTPTCICCGEKIEQFLVIDHINGGGSKERKERGSGASFYHWLRKNNFPRGYRVLCHNCNASLSCYKFCPHNPSVRVTS